MDLFFQLNITILFSLRSRSPLRPANLNLMTSRPVGCELGYPSPASSVSLGWDKGFARLLLGDFFFALVTYFFSPLLLLFPHRPWELLGSRLSWLS